MFKQENRLKSKYEIGLVKRNGANIKGRYFLCLYLRDNTQKKLTVIVSTKFDKKAVVRNKVKRQIRDVVYKKIDLMPKGFYLFIPKKHIINTKHEEISSDINQVLSAYFKF